MYYEESVVSSNSNLLRYYCAHPSRWKNRSRNGLKSLFNLTEFLLLLDATNGKLTGPEAVRGGDTTSCETKKLSIKLVPSSQDDESSKGNGNSADHSRKRSRSHEKKRRRMGKREREWGRSQIQKVKSYLF